MCCTIIMLILCLGYPLQPEVKHQEETVNLMTWCLFLTCFRTCSYDFTSFCLFGQHYLTTLSLQLPHSHLATTTYQQLLHSHTTHTSPRGGRTWWSHAIAISKPISAEQSIPECALYHWFVLLSFSWGATSGFCLNISELLPIPLSSDRGLAPQALCY